MSGSIEEFDDDTDFALPTVPSVGGSNAQGGPSAAAGPGAGMSMEAMQQMMAQMQGGSGAGGAAGMPPGMMNMMGGPGGPVAPAPVELSAEEKKWVTVYPIYFDAKRRFEKGCRRVSYAQSCLWPKSDAIEKAAARLTLMHAHEARKTHPRDWENPGRVKVQLFNEDGEPLNQKLKTKKELLRAIAEIIQPQCGGSPPPLPAHPKKPVERSVKTEDKKSNVKSAATKQPQPFKNAKTHAEKPSNRVPIRIDAKDRIKAASKSKKANASSLVPVSSASRLPPYSPSREAGLLNADFGGMMGGLQGMGPLGAMMGSMGLGDDDDDEAGGAEADAEKEEDKKKKDPMQQLSRRQRKRVIRVGR